MDQNGPVTISPPAAMVGRTEELALLRNRLERAIRGEPSVVLLSGDAGIGKTRLARELMRLGEEQGVRVCFGRFIEDSAVPYLAFVNSIVPEMRRAGLTGTGLAALDPAGPDATTGQPALPPDTNTGAFIQTLVGGAFALAKERPLLLVIDDVQWAEPLAQDIFAHLALAIADAAPRRACPILLVGLHRPVEDADTLSRILARLRREAAVVELRLDGLEELDLSDLVQRSTDTRCSAALLHGLLRATNGNPLFVIESLRTLASHHALERRQGMLGTDYDPRELPLPAEVTLSIAERVRALDGPLRAALSVAALLGDEFQIEELEASSELTPELAGERVERALAAGLIVESSEGVFRFSHPLIRRVCQDAIPATRRRKLHAEIARKLIDRARNRPISALRIGHHLLAAGREADPLTVGERAVEAGRQAYAAYAWNEAGRYYEAALAAAPYVVTLTEEEVARLRLAAGDAHHRASDFAQARTRYGEAMERFRGLGDVPGWGSALVGWARSEAVQSNQPLESKEVDRFLEAAGDEHPMARAQVLAFWASILFVTGSPDATAVASEALRLGKANGPSVSAIEASISLGGAQTRAFEPDLAVASYIDAIEMAREMGDDWHLAAAYPRLAFALLSLGRLAETEEALDRGEEVTERLRDFSELSLVLSVKVCLLVARGDLDGAEQAASRAQSAIDYSGYAWSAPFLYAPLVYARRLQGRTREALDALEILERTVGKAAAWLARLLFPPYDTAESVRRAIEEHPQRAAWMTDQRDVLALGIVATRAMAAHRAEEAAPPATLAVLHEAATRGLVLSISPPILLERLAATSLAFAGQRDDAIALLRTAADHANTLGLALERAQAELELAELLAARSAPGDIAAASAFAARAAAAASELGLGGLAMEAAALAERHRFDLGSPQSAHAYPEGLSELQYNVLSAIASGLTGEALERALVVGAATREAAERVLAELGVRGPTEAQAFLDRHERELPADVPLTRETADVMASTGPRAFLFSDMVGSTALQGALGDELYARLLQRHDALVRRCIRQHGGHEVKRTGDGFFASFRDGASAIHCARAVQAEMPVALPDHPQERAFVRIGIHVGEAVEMGDDLFGLAVSTAARVCARGHAGDILVSDSTRSSARTPEIQFQRYGRFALKGLSERMTLYRVPV